MKRTSVSFLTAGLKGSYKFKSVFIPISSNPKTIAKVHSILYGQVLGAVSELEHLNLIDGFHFIVHKGVDLRLSAPDWRKNVAAIKDILGSYDIPNDLEDWGPLPWSMYGGKYGEALCYNNLEFNSRVILGFLEAQQFNFKMNRSGMFNALYGLVVSQFIHYLYYQYGLVGTEEINTLFRVCFTRLRMLLRRASNVMGEEGEMSESDFTCYVNEITDYMDRLVRGVKKDFEFSIWKRIWIQYRKVLKTFRMEIKR